MSKLQDSLLKTLVYADLFEYPLRSREIYRFMITDKAISATSFNKLLSRMEANQKLIKTNGEYYFLVGRKKIVSVRRRREKWSQGKLKIANRVAQKLKIIPWVKMVAATGALAMNNAEKDDDIDLLVVTAENRLWLTRLLAVLLIEVVANRRRPNDKEVKDKICLNMFLDEAHLRVPKNEQDLFTAHEVCQLKPLWEKDQAYQKFLKTNQWAKEYLSNSLETKKPRNQETKKQESPSVLQFFSSSVSSLDKFAMDFQIRYMAKRKTNEVVEPGRILFHPQDARKWILKEYQLRLKKLKP
jgi:hypothetical protein